MKQRDIGPDTGLTCGDTATRRHAMNAALVPTPDPLTSYEHVANLMEWLLIGPGIAEIDYINERFNRLLMAAAEPKSLRNDSGTRGGDYVI